MVFLGALASSAVSQYLTQAPSVHDPSGFFWRAKLKLFLLLYTHRFVQRVQYRPLWHMWISYVGTPVGAFVGTVGVAVGTVGAAEGALDG
jgi:hypothetical protein